MRMEIVLNGEIIQYTVKTQTDSHNVSREYLRATVVVSSNPITGSCKRKEITAPDIEKLKAKIQAIQHVRSLDNGSILPFHQYMEE